MSQIANDNDENASRDGANNDDVTGDGGGVPGDDNDVESTKAEDAQSISGVNEENIEDGEGEFYTREKVNSQMTDSTISCLFSKPWFH